MDVWISTLCSTLLTLTLVLGGPLEVTLTRDGDPSPPSVGESLTLNCHVKGARSEATVYWKQSPGTSNGESVAILPNNFQPRRALPSDWKRSVSKYTENADVSDIEDQSFRLTVGNLNYSDDGIYFCVAVTDNRNGSDSITVIVEGKPEITTSGESKRTGIIGRREVIHFQYTSRPHVQSVQWFGPGEDHLDLNTSRYQIEKSQDSIHGRVTLDIDNFSLEDVGNYRVVLENARGVTEAAVELDASPLLNVVSPNSSTSFPFGSTALFICRAANFNNTPALTWTHGMNKVDPASLRVKKNMSIKINSTQDGSIESVIAIRGITYDFIGSLECTASDDDWSSSSMGGASSAVGVTSSAGGSTDKSVTFSDSVMLDVIGPPLIESQRRTVRGDIGDTVRLECNVTSNPPPTQLRWLFNRDVLGFREYATEGLNRQTHLTMRHVVDVTSLNDYGSYMCQVTNKYGKIGYSISLVAPDPVRPECPGCTGLMVCDETLGACVCPIGYFENKSGSCEVTTISEEPQSQTYTDNLLVGISSGAVLVVMVTMGVVLIFCWRRRVTMLKRKNIEEQLGKVNAAYTHAQYATANIYEVITRPADEFPRERLRFQHPLGVGKFGRVMKGEALSINRTGAWEEVAVKMCQESATDLDKEDLYNELVIIRKIPKHINIVSFFGACTYGEPLLIILEYVPGGDLRNYLRRKRPASEKCFESPQSEFESPLGLEIQTMDLDDGELTAKDLLSFALQSAKGMQHLEANSIVHRDVAARNVLIGYNGVCKVSDFGLARDVEGVDVYERTSKGPLPIRWMSPESLMEGSHSHKADVWAYGILLWEIVTLGASPYSTLSLRSVIDAVVAGKRLEKPQHCMDELYSLMGACWEHLPRDRPTFGSISRDLEYLLEKEADYIQLDQFQEAVYMVLEPESNDERL